MAGDITYNITDQEEVLRWEYNLTLVLLLTDQDSVCLEYFIENRERLIKALLEKAEVSDLDADELLHNFVVKVHERHLAGHSLKS